MAWYRVSSRRQISFAEARDGWGSTGAPQALLPSLPAEVFSRPVERSGLESRPSVLSSSPLDFVQSKEASGGRNEAETMMMHCESSWLSQPLEGRL